MEQVREAVLLCFSVGSASVRAPTSLKDGQKLGHVGGNKRRKKKGNE